MTATAQTKTGGQGWKSARAMRMMDGGKTPIWETTLVDREGTCRASKGRPVPPLTISSLLKFTHLAHPSSLINIQLTDSPVALYSASQPNPFSICSNGRVRDAIRLEGIAPGPAVQAEVQPSPPSFFVVCDSLRPCTCTIQSKTRVRPDPSVPS